MDSTPIILHCHIPKTAGTTFSVTFQRAFGIHHLHHTHSNPLFVLNREVLEELLGILPGLRSITSHHFGSFPMSLCGRRTFLVTLLRKPEDLFISQLRHYQRDASTFPSEWQSHCSNRIDRLPLREFASQFLDLIPPGTDLCFQTSYFYSPGRFAKFVPCRSADDGLRAYQAAKLILSEFHFVGITEEMKKSMEVLEDLLAQQGTGVAFNHRETQNRAPDRARPAWLTMEDEVGRRVLEISENDRLLYNHFREKLLESHRELRDRKWLGFRAAALNATEAFRRDRLPGIKESLVHSKELFLKRGVAPNHLPRIPEAKLRTDLLEERTR